jgi:hypothetical protein
MIAKYLLLITKYLSVVPGSPQWASPFLLGDCAELSERPIKLIVCFPAGGPDRPHDHVHRAAYSEYRKQGILECCGNGKFRRRLKSGAARGIRTPDPIITNDVLYRLSYCGISWTCGSCKIVA